MTIDPGGKPRTWFTMKRQDQADDEDELAAATGDPEIDPNQTVPADAEIMVYDEIGMWGVSAADFDRELKALGDVKSINMRINSPGGDSFAGIAIYNTLQAHPATITTRVDGIAASAASLIAMAGDKIIMPDNTFMLVHEPFVQTSRHARTAPWPRSAIGYRRAMPTCTRHAPGRHWRPSTA